MPEPDPDPDLSSSYVDFPALLSPSFSCSEYASRSVQRTIDSSDQTIDLSPALARVLFDIQELDSRIDSITRRSGLTGLSRCVRQDDAAEAVLSRLDGLVDRLAGTYDELEKAVLVPADRAEKIGLVASRVCDTVTVLRVVARVLVLTRQLQAQTEEVRRWVGAAKTEGGRGAGSGDDTAGPELLLETARKVQTLKAQLAAGRDTIDRIETIKSVHRTVIQPTIRTLLLLAQERVQAELGNANRLVSLSSSAAPAAISPAGSGHAGTSADDDDDPGHAGHSAARTAVVAQLRALHVLGADTKPNRFTAVLKAALDGHVDETVTVISQAVLRHPVLLAQLFPSPGGGAGSNGSAGTGGGGPDSVRRNIGLILPNRVLQFLGHRSRAVHELEKVASLLDRDRADLDEPVPERCSPLAELLDHLDASSVTNFFFLSLSQKLTRALTSSANPSSFSRAASLAASSFAGQYQSVFNNLLPLSGLGLSSFRSQDPSAGSGSGPGSPPPAGHGSGAGGGGAGGIGSLLGGASGSHVPLPPHPKSEISRLVRAVIEDALSNPETVASGGDGSVASPSSATSVDTTVTAATALLTQAIAIGMAAAVASGGAGAGAGGGGGAGGDGGGSGFGVPADSTLGRSNSGATRRW